MSFTVSLTVGEHLPHVMGRVLYVVDEDNKSRVIEELSLHM